MIKKMSPKEFYELGFLQEANRQFFHPLGIALEMVIDNDTGECEFGSIWDYRDDEEGIIFGNAENENHSKERIKKIENISKLKNEKDLARQKIFGWSIQPIEEITKIKKNETS